MDSGAEIDAKSIKEGVEKYFVNDDDQDGNKVAYGLWDCATRRFWSPVRTLPLIAGQTSPSFLFSPIYSLVFVLSSLVFTCLLLSCPLLAGSLLPRNLNSQIRQNPDLSCLVLSSLPLSCPVLSWFGFSLPTRTS